MPELVADPATRPGVTTDVVRLIDAEVASKSGLGGMAIKGGYKVVKRLKGGRMIPDVVDGLLPDFARSIDPLHQAYLSSGATGGFAAYLAANKTDAINALLSITDERARTTSNTTLKKTYEKLRPVGEKNVGDALPALGALIDKHCS